MDGRIFGGIIELSVKRMSNITNVALADRMTLGHRFLYINTNRYEKLLLFKVL